MDERKQAKLRVWLRVLLIATLCLIWGNSLIPGKESGQLSHGLTAWLQSIGIPVGEHFVRKAAHFCEFALLGTELAALLRLSDVSKLQGLCSAASAALGAALVDESIQLFIPNRGPLLADVLLDFAGAMTGIALCTLAIHYYLRQKTDKRDHRGR